MRNPIRVKNLRLRFAPLYLAAVALLFVVQPGASVYAAGAALIVLGAALRSWGAGHLVKTEQLTVSGPYAFLRHPLYLGTLLAGVGVALMAGGWWAAGVLTFFLPWFFLVYFPRKEASESVRLEGCYGEAFREYRAAVPALLPRLTPFEPSLALEDLAFSDRHWSDRHWSLARYSKNNELGTLLGLVALVVLFGIRTAVVLGDAWGRQ